MNVRAMYIPRSEKGREVARYLRSRGYRVHDSDVLGTYVSSLEGIGIELVVKDMEEVAILLVGGDEVDRAWYDAQERADRIQDNPASYGLTEAGAETESRRIGRRSAWLFGE